MSSLMMGLTANDITAAHTITYEDYLLIRPFFQGIAPTLRIPVAAWANKYRYLAAGASARPGLYDTANTPYLIEIMNCLGVTSDCEEIIFMKSAQVGATEAGNNWLGYIIHIAPGATLMVVPTDEMMRNNSNVRIDPMISASPVLRSRIGKGKKDGNTTSRKKFPGGFHIYCGANSPVGLSSLPVQYLFFDETDRYPPSVGKEGSALSLGKARTTTYVDSRKIFYVSTPTIDGLSAIQAEFMNSTQEHYHVPCPHCGLMQDFVFERLEWKEGEPETAVYHCAGCEDRIEEKFKRWMVDPARARWTSHNPTFRNKRRRGFHINALYSLLGYTWAKAVEDYIAAQGNDLKMCTWTNTVAGLCWKEVVDVPDWRALYERRMSYKFNVPPKDAAFITAGCDVQKDRIEVEIVAWCKGKESYSLDYRVLPGDTSAAQVWLDLAAIVEERWTREDGAIMPLRMMCVDANYNKQAVYDFCQNYDTSKVIPIRGVQKQEIIIGAPKALQIAKDGKAIGTMKTWGIGTDVAKSELYGWLRQFKTETTPNPIGYCNFPMYDEHYFKMLTAEQRQIIVNKKGHREYAWILPAHVRNEALDCRCYARAAAAAVHMDLWKPERWDYERDLHMAITAPSQITKAAKSEASTSPQKNNSDYLGDTDNWL